MSFWGGCSDRLLEIDCQRNESCVYVRGSLSSQVPVTTNSPTHSSYLDKRKPFSAVISSTPGTWNLKPSINTFTISTKVIQGWKWSTGVSWRELTVKEASAVGFPLPLRSTILPQALTAAAQLHTPPHKAYWTFTYQGHRNSSKEACILWLFLCKSPLFTSVSLSNKCS